MRTEEEVLSAKLRLRLGDQEVELRELRIRELRGWKEKLGGALGGVGNFDIQGDPGSISRLMNVVGDRLQDLVLEYDVDGKLSRALLEDSTESQVYTAFRRILEAAFPFVSDIRGALAQLSELTKAAPQPPARSTSGPLPIGASTRKRSKVA